MNVKSIMTIKNGSKTNAGTVKRPNQKIVFTIYVQSARIT